MGGPTPERERARERESNLVSFSVVELCFFFRPEKSKNKNQKTTIGLQKKHSIPETTRMQGREGF